MSLRTFLSRVLQLLKGGSDPQPAPPPTSRPAARPIRFSRLEDRRVFNASFVLNAAGLTLDNFTRAWAAAPFARYFLNTVLLVLGIMIGQFVICTLAAFGLVHRPDDVLKEGWLHQMEPGKRQRLVGVFEDRKCVVDMWRRNGVTCFQVAEGDF